MSWQDNIKLQNKLFLSVKNNLTNKEILLEVQNEFPDYQWSLSTLKRRLKFFKITKIDKNVTPQQLLNALEKELDGPGKLLGYRTLHQKIRNEHDLLVTRNDVYLGMNLIAPEGLESRRFINERKKFHKRCFISKGSNWVWSFDGHDKLMGYRKSQFPLAIHGCVDTFSRKIMWLRIWPTNSMPELPATLFLKAIFECGYVPCYTRSDRGTETVLICAIQNLLHHSNTSRHFYGSSISNQVIEQWWRGLRERNGVFFKDLLCKLVTTHYYNESNSTCKVLLAYLLIPIIQNELNSFKANWNSHRIRLQDIARPCGVVRLMYEYPEAYGGEQCGTVPQENDFNCAVVWSNSFVNFEFIDDLTKNEIQGVLTNNNINEITIKNVLEVYGILIQNLRDHDFNFTYS